MRNGFDGAADGDITWYPLPFEVGLLESLVTQLVELVDAPAWSDDPLERWANEHRVAPLDREDPALARLFPEASSDEEVAGEYRRLMEAELRTQKAAEAELVLAALRPAVGEAEPEVRIVAAEVDPWLRTLNALRLVLGARLEITDDEDAEEIDGLDEDDVRAPTADVYHWLGHVQGGLLDAIVG